MCAMYILLNKIRVNSQQILPSNPMMLQPLMLLLMLLRSLCVAQSTDTVPRSFENDDTIQGYKDDVTMIRCF